MIAVTPIGKNSSKIYQKKEHILIGASPFNSYFSEQNLTILLDWGLKTFQDMHVLVPNKISYYNFLALGYSENKAKEKTRRQDNYLINKIKRAFGNLEISETEANRKIVLLNDFKKNSTYQQLYSICLNLFEKNADFKKGCLETSSWIFKNYLNVTENTLESFCVRYLLYEFPFFMNSSSILQVPSSLFVYHSIPEYLKKLYEKIEIVSSSQGFLKALISTGSF